MSQDLLRYYESELAFIRQMAGEFAQKYPKVAGRLDFRDAESSDPHVERLIEAFAILTGRVRHKVEDEFPEIVESLLGVMYPHYLRPRPPMAIGQFQFDPRQSRPTAGVTIPAGSVLHTRPAGGTVGTFRTCYPATVWPLNLTSATLVSTSAVRIETAPLEAAAVLRLQLETLGGIPLSTLKIDTLRFFLNGSGSPLYRLHELLFTQTLAVQLRSQGETRTQTSDCVKPIGYQKDEGLVPYSDRSFLGYRLLEEYFTFPEKFLFVEFTGLAEAFAGLGSKCDLLVFFRDSELREHLPSITQIVKADTFQLGCTPIVNLFERMSEPIRVSHTLTEYRVIPDLHRQATTEVYSVDRVSSTAAYSEEPQTYEPFYSLRHSYSAPKSECFWYAHRRPSMRKGDDGTEVFLSLVDLKFNPTLPPVELISAAVTCTNRDFLSRMSWQMEWGEIEGEAGPNLEARCLTKPTPAVRPPLGGGLQWRLVSHLALNRLSIVQGGGSEALREILKLYCFQEDEDARKRIDGITGLRSRSSVSRIPFDFGVTFCRGLDVEVDLDEEQFTGSSAFLLASVLDRFFALYSALNSYSRLTATSKQRRTPIHRWPARIGEQRVL
jgi:type VI secretion system protein ImpG